MSPEEMNTDWLRPIGHDPATVGGWTRLGTLDGPSEPIVDPRGVVQVAPSAPGIAWWIAGDDRWYFPSRENTVRQSIMHGTPVVETRMRVKGGDVCQRVYAVTVPGASALREVVVIEIENTTGVPCGAAFAIRPFGVLADTPVHRVRIDGGVLEADGAPVLVLPREPAGALGGIGAGGDLVGPVMRGEATGAFFPPVDCVDGRAQAVVVVPLAHRNVFRVVLPVPDPTGAFDEEARTFPDGIPPAENVAKGWRAQVRDLARVTVPDPRLQAVCDAAPSWLLATTNHAGAETGRSIWDERRAPRWDRVAATAGALDRVGLHERSGVLLARAVAAFLVEPVGDASPLIGAFATHLARTGDAAFAAAVTEVSAQIVAQLQRRRGGSLPPGRRAQALLAAAEVFDHGDQPRAAASARKAAAEMGTTGTALQPSGHAGPAMVDRCEELVRQRLALADGDGTGAWEVLDRYLDEVTSTGVWAEGATDGVDRHDVGVGAAVVSLAFDLLGVADDDRMRLLAHTPDAWVGTSMECHRISTPGGLLGYAVRWHDRRAAVLWELDAGANPEPVPGDVAVTAPGLDPAWQGRGAAGEALLEEVAGREQEPKQGSRITGLQIGQSRGTA